MSHATPETLTPAQIAAIAMHPVKSSNLQAVGYDLSLAVLFVAFTPPAHSPDAEGSLYAYFSVPDEVAAGLIHASTMIEESCGSYFSTHIKPAKNYVCVCLRKAPKKAA